LSTVDPEVHRVVFLANLADPRAFGPRLTEFVRKGGNLVVGVGDNATADRYNAALGGILPAAFDRTRDLADPAEEGVPLELPDPKHPLFAPFARGGRGGFPRVKTHRVIRLEPYAESEDVATLLRYEGGVPALVERKLGSGRVLVWTSTFDLGWTNLPLQAVFMPLMQRIVAYLGGEGGEAEGRFEATVGDTVSIPLPDLAVEPDVVGPNGELVRRQIESGRLLFTADRPGAYALQVEEMPALAWVAVNTPVEESDVRRSQSIARVEQELRPELFLRRIDLSPWLLAAAMVLLVTQAAASLRGTA
jgi:hypothetical protein